MSAEFLAEELCFLEMLKDALQGKVHLNTENSENISIDYLFTTAKKHAVLSLLYEIVKEMPMADEQKSYFERECRQTVLQSYRLLFFSKYLTTMLESNGISSIVLKGSSTAKFYPFPELRKSGDIDLLISKNTNMEQLVRLMEREGFIKKDKQHANHHVEFVYDGGIIVEIHTDLTEEFAYKKINHCMNKRAREYFDTKIEHEIMGVVLPVLNKPFHAYELMLHALHHFMRTGFGLKFLCDWTVLWSLDWTEEEKKLFEELSTENNTKRFAETMTAVCVRYLGLDKNHFAWEYLKNDIPIEDFLREVFDAEEFGRSEENRMVMMNGTGIGAYVKEFHHQMHLNFPKAGKCFLLWPVLWVITLIKFLYNNRKVRKVSARNILKEARRRSKLVEKMRLFE